MCPQRLETVVRSVQQGLESLLGWSADNHDIKKTLFNGLEISRRHHVSCHFVRLPATHPRCVRQVSDVAAEVVHDL